MARIKVVKLLSSEETAPEGYNFAVCSPVDTLRVRGVRGAFWAVDVFCKTRADADAEFLARSLSGGAAVFCLDSVDPRIKLIKEML